MTEWGIDTLFNPGKRHMDEEKRRLQSTREEIGDSSGGRRIDLESGKMRIERTDKTGPDETADPAVAEVESDDDSKPALKAVPAAPSSAAERAAARRAKQI